MIPINLRAIDKSGMVYFAAKDLDGAKSQSSRGPQIAPFSSQKEANAPLTEGASKTWKDTALKITKGFAIGTALGGILSYANFDPNGYPIYSAFPTVIAYGFGVANALASLNAKTKTFMETTLVFGAICGSWPGGESLALGMSMGAIAGAYRTITNWKEGKKSIQRATH